MKKRFESLDLTILIAVYGLLFIGLMALYSTSLSLVQSGTGSNFFMSQLRWIAIGSIVMLIAAFLPNRMYFDYAYLAYIFALALLLMVLKWGTTGYGATRWLNIAGFGFQPSEIAKIATLLAVGRFLSEERSSINRPRTFIIASAIILAPFLLVARQPDLGTGLVFIVIALPIFFWAGLRPNNLLLIIAPVLALFASFNIYLFVLYLAILLACLLYMRAGIVSGVLYFAFNIGVGFLTPRLWGQLKDYQQQRIITFWNPEADPLGAGYQIIQSKVAIGSGGLFGKGFLQGSQTQLRFLPEQHSDFIFAVIGEEFGFLGVVAGLVLFTVFLMRTVHLASIFRSRFNSAITIGIAVMIGFQMFVNIGMTIGFFPVTGLPLPFISYGGTALLTNMVLVGMILNFHRNKFEY